MASTEEIFSVLNVKCVEETGLKARSFSFLEESRNLQKPLKI